MENTIKKTSQSTRIPVDVLRRNPHFLRHVLGICMGLNTAQLDGYSFSHGWENNMGLVIKAQPPGDETPVFLECNQVRPYKTLVTVYEIDHD